MSIRFNSHSKYEVSSRMHPGFPARFPSMKWKTYLTVCLITCFFLIGGVLTAAEITIISHDGPTEGFNDPTPIIPIGGNTGTTLGEQRLIAVQYAAEIWGSLLHSDVEILVDATFDALLCNGRTSHQCSLWLRDSL